MRPPPIEIFRGRGISMHMHKYNSRSSMHIICIIYTQILSTLATTIMTVGKHGIVMRKAPGAKCSPVRQPMVRPSDPL